MHNYHKILLQIERLNEISSVILYTIYQVLNHNKTNLPIPTSTACFSAAIKRASLPYARLLIGLFEKATIDMKGRELIFIPPQILVYNILFSIIVFRESIKRKTSLTSTSQKTNEDDDLATLMS